MHLRRQGSRSLLFSRLKSASRRKSRARMHAWFASLCPGRRDPDQRHVTAILLLPIPSSAPTDSMRGPCIVKWSLAGERLGVANTRTCINLHTAIQRGLILSKKKSSCMGWRSYIIPQDCRGHGCTVSGSQHFSWNQVHVYIILPSCYCFMSHTHLHDISRWRKG
jgi:hypothetical protein